MKFNLKKAAVTLVAAVTMFSCVGFVAPVQAASTSSYKQSDLKLNVKSALAIDSRTGQILYAKNANQALPIASMTKLVTVYLTLQAIKNKQLTWKTKIEPTAAIVKVANNSEYSNVPLKRKHLYTIKQLYQATLIESANGAAMCLAQAVSGSQVAFVKKMRKQLKSWEISDAKIYTVCGLPNGNVGKDAYPGISKNAENEMSAKDMAIVSQHLLNEFPQVINTTKIAHLNFKDQGSSTKMENFNWMLKGLSQYDSSLHVDGLKTGTTDAAGACFVGTATHNGGRIITVVMGARHQDGTDPSRFVQTKKLMNWLYARYTPVVVKAGTNFVNAKTISINDGDQLTTPIGLKNNTVLWDPVDGAQLTAKTTAKTIEAPISKGQKVTNYQFTSGKEKLISLSQPNGMKIAAKAMQANKKINFFVKIWRWITGAR